MKVYLVGGAVRDGLLGLPIKDRDWLVVGGTPAALLAQGFRPVGRDFPVFLHPHTQEEYALARTERKSGHGYRGFDTCFDPDIRLEDDLLRRDLTINAMAQDQNGQLIDPFDGQRDLNQRLLRHVSPAFAEDPLRVLRVARFAARYAQHQFRIAPETLELMRSMSQSGELEHLTPERIWQETQQALTTEQPAVFFNTLHQVSALTVLLPELAALDGVPQNPAYHPEVDTYRHTMMALEVAAREQYSAEIRFAVLVHDLGKALTPHAQWPKHIGHEQLGLPAVDQLCKRLRCPNTYHQLASLTCRWHLLIHRALSLRPSTLLKVLEKTDALRRPQRFIDLLNACRCDALGRLGKSDDGYPQSAYLQGALNAARRVQHHELLAQGLKNQALGEAIKKQRIRALSQFRNNYRKTNITNHPH